MKVQKVVYKILILVESHCGYVGVHCVILQLVSMFENFHDKVWKRKNGMFKNFYDKIWKRKKQYVLESQESGFITQSLAQITPLVFITKSFITKL